MNNDEDIIHEYELKRRDIEAQLEELDIENKSHTKLVEEYEAMMVHAKSFIEEIKDDIGSEHISKEIFDLEDDLMEGCRRTELALNEEKESLKLREHKLNDELEASHDEFHSKMTKET